MMKSIGQPSLKTLTDARENPATGEKQHANQDVSQVYHGNVTSVPRKSRDAHPFGDLCASFCAEVGHQRFRRPQRSGNAAAGGGPVRRLFSRHKVTCAQTPSESYGQTVDLAFQEFHRHRRLIQGQRVRDFIGPDQPYVRLQFSRQSFCHLQGRPRSRRVRKDHHDFQPLLGVPEAGSW